jgi:serine phosphatase RsbU (regulator of sigma subunit)
MASSDPVLTESLWRPRSALRLVAGLLAALALPEVVTRLLLGGFVDRFPSLLYVACVVVSAMLGRFAAGLLAVVASVLLLDYYVVDPRWSFNPFHDTVSAIDFIVFVVVTVLVAAVLSGTDRSRVAAQRARERADEAQRQLEVIAQVSRALAASFDLPATVREVCRRVAAAGGWQHVVMLRHQRSGFEYLADAAGVPYEPAPGPVMDAAAAAIEGGQIEVLKPSPWRARQFGPARYRSGLVIPLIGDTEPAGVLVLLLAKVREFQAEDLLTAGEIGGRIAMAVQNAGRYQHQRHIAHTLQQGLLPRNLPSVPGLRVHALYQAGAGTEVGGDFYDIFSIDDNRWLVVVGDVCGKGPEAATVMSVTRATLRALAMHEPSPSRLLGRLNEALLAQVPDGRFVTVSCAFIEMVPAGGAKVILVQAGHPAPVITRKGAPPMLAPANNGTLLGAFPRVNLSETSVTLEPGEMLTFYTDGIEEGQVTAEERAMDLLAAHGDGPAPGIAERFANAVRSTAAGKADDLVVLTLEFTPAPGR